MKCAGLSGPEPQCLHGIYPFDELLWNLEALFPGQGKFTGRQIVISFIVWLSPISITFNSCGESIKVWSVEFCMLNCFISHTRPSCSHTSIRYFPLLVGIHDNLNLLFVRKSIGVPCDGI